MQGSQSFCFDKLCQIRIPSWTKGRVALVGDAGDCASPAAGMGGSLAIDGASALADAMREHPGDFERAFRDYNEKFRPFIDEVQAEAVRTGLEMLVPRTEEAIRARNAQTGSAFQERIGDHGSRTRRGRKGASDARVAQGPPRPQRTRHRDQAGARTPTGISDAADRTGTHAMSGMRVP
ncbi:Oxidoreductase protein [Minicystis rosea]|nr:Oxidoreductase protein [Minicystis rosea]